MSLKAWLLEQQRYAAANTQRAPLWTGTSIALYVYGINGIVGEVGRAFDRPGWDLHGVPLLVAALGAAIGGTLAARQSRISVTAT